MSEAPGELSRVGVVLLQPCRRVSGQDFVERSSQSSTGCMEAVVSKLGHVCSVCICRVVGTKNRYLRQKLCISEVPGFWLCVRVWFKSAHFFIFYVFAAPHADLHTRKHGHLWPSHVAIPPHSLLASRFPLVLTHNYSIVLCRTKSDVRRPFFFTFL